MSAIIGPLLLTVLCTGIGGVQGECRHVKNDDMVEYSCVGGELSDLDGLPAATAKIRISNMPIPRITADTFSRFGSELWVLGCSYCGIADIEPDAFESLVNLQQLSLDNNYLTTVKESWFRGLEYMTYLDLNYNRIESIEDGVFKNLPSLVDLRLNGNRLKCLNLEDMARLKDLKRMFLSENSELKCPHAVSDFLENQGVSFERDPEWKKIPHDLIAVETPFDYYGEYDEATAVPTTPLPTYRERLHLASVTPPSPVESTPPYAPPRVHTTEEVVYNPTYFTPDWRTIQRQSAALEDREQTTVSRPSYADERRTYVTPGTIGPFGPMTRPSYDTTAFSNVDETTLRSWPRFPESSSARPEFPVYPAHENEDKRYEQPYYPSVTANAFSLAPVPSDRYETPPFVESNVEHTTVPYGMERPETNTIGSDPRYPSVDDDRPPEYRIPQTNRRTEMIEPASPASESNRPRQEEGVVTAGVGPIETTTDKPLPNCSNRNLSSLTNRSVGIIALSILMAIANVLAEGF